MKERRAYRERSPKRIAGVQLAEKALELRIAGKTFAQIGAALGISDTHAHRLVTNALAERKEHRARLAEGLLELELERCDRLQRALATQVARGDVRAVVATLKVMERRARLLGLDAAQKLEYVGDASKMVDARVAAMMAREIFGSPSALENQDAASATGASQESAVAVEEDVLSVPTQVDA
jgi:hypothetical protein